MKPRKMAVVAKSADCEVCGYRCWLVDQTNGKGGQWVHVSEYGSNPHPAVPAL